MANTAQSDLTALSAIIEADNSLTKAQKAQAQTHLYALLKILFGHPVENATIGNGHGG